MKIRSRVGATLAATAVTTAGIATFGATSAHAAVYSERATDYNNSPNFSKVVCVGVGYGRNPNAGHVCFEPYGDEFWVRDLAADGHHIEMRGQVNTTGDGFRCYSYAGAAAGWTRCDSFSSLIPENAAITFTAGVYEKSKLLSVSQIQMARTS